MSTTENRELETGITLSEQAAHWWVALHGDTVAAADKQAFAAWVARSPERIEAYLRMARLMGALHSPKVDWPDVPAATLVQEARSATAEIMPLARAGVEADAVREPRVRRPRMRLYSALAAMVLVAAGTALFLHMNPQRYQTALGEQRSVLLEDGSLVMLNTSSQIEVDMQKERRVIRLLAGEALFQVAHEIGRPFEVHAGATTIRAVGTQFNVDRRMARTTVTVLEGRVIVADQGVAESPGSYLQSAERIVVTGAGLGARERIANVAPVTAWTQRQLVFERRLLGEVAEEFNRYNRRHIQIEDGVLANQRVTGVFQANDPASFMTFLKEIPGVRIQETEEGVRIVRRVP